MDSMSGSDVHRELAALVHRERRVAGEAVGLSSCASRCRPWMQERNRGAGAVGRYRAPVEIRELAVPDSYALDLVPHGDRGGVSRSGTGPTSVPGSGTPADPGPGQPQRLGARCPARRPLRPRAARARPSTSTAPRAGCSTWSSTCGSARPRSACTTPWCWTASSRARSYLAEGLGHALRVAGRRQLAHLPGSTGYDPSGSSASIRWTLSWTCPGRPISTSSCPRRTGRPRLAQAREQGLLPTYAESTARYAELRGR